MAVFKITLGTAVTWGAPTALGASKGTVLSCETKSTTKMADQMGDQGGLDSVVCYDQRDEVTVEILAGTAATLPAVGDSINIGGITSVLVTESSEKWANTSGKKFSISGFKSVA